MSEITENDVADYYIDLARLPIADAPPEPAVRRHPRNVATAAKLTIGWSYDSTRARWRQRGQWSATKGAVVIAVSLPVLLFVMSMLHTSLAWAVCVFGAAIIGIGFLLLFAMIGDDRRSRH